MGGRQSNLLCQREPGGPGAFQLLLQSNYWTIKVLLKALDCHFCGITFRGLGSHYRAWCEWNRRRFRDLLIAIVSIIPRLQLGKRENRKPEATSSGQMLRFILGFSSSVI